MKSKKAKVPNPPIPVFECFIKLKEKDKLERIELPFVPTQMAIVHLECGLLFAWKHPKATPSPILSSTDSSA